MNHSTILKLSNPRSQLHAMQPLGQGSEQAESLLSYFCRLAMSHSTSTLELSRQLMMHFEGESGIWSNLNNVWYERKISGLGDGAKTYVEALAAATTVVGLEKHTFLPWQHVIANNGLAVHPHGKFCTQCLQEDMEQGATPYLRLCWEPSLVTVCHRHQTPLVHHCPHCGDGRARHTSSFTVVGWCGKCGMFMGQKADAESARGAVADIDETKLWQAQQIAHLICTQQSAAIAIPQRSAVMSAIEYLIEKACDGKYAKLAEQLGIAKSTLHSWLREGRTPQLDISLRIARLGRLDLVDLLCGNTSDWIPPEANPQLELPMDYPSRPVWNRVVAMHDWPSVERKLQAILVQPMPVSVLHAASVVQVPRRMLYLHCNTTARKISRRWFDYLKRRQQEDVAAAWPYLESACRQLMDMGISPNQREVEKLVPASHLNKINGCWDVIRTVCEHIRNSELATSQLCGDSYTRRYVSD